MIADLWREIDAWFEKHEATKNLENRRKPATKAQIAALEKRIGRKLPKDFRESLEIHNGGGNFASYELYGVKEIGDEWASKTRLHEDGTIKKTLWNRAWIPFAQDSCGNLKALDPEKERLLALEFQGPQGVFATRRRTFEDWLAGYAALLREGKYVVDEGGFVGEYVAPRKRHPDEVGKELENVVSTAVCNDDVATIRKLLDAGTIKPDSRTAFEEPMLTDAARHNARAVFELLIERGANVNISAGDGHNPLIACCYTNDPHLDVIERLLESGADPMTKDSHHEDAIAVAKMYRQEGLVALLQKYAKMKKPKKKPPAKTKKKR